MKKLLLPLCLIAAISALAQVSYREVAAPRSDATAYDSLDNIPVKLKTLYGQTALVVNLNELYKSRRDFDGLNDTSVINQYFHVISATRDDSRPQIWVMLGNATDTIFFRLTNSSRETPPFITVGFYEKHKLLSVNKKFRLKIDTDLREINTGIKKNFKRTDTFTCIDIALTKHNDELIPSYILVNSKNEEIAIPIRGFERDSDSSILRFDTLQ